MHYCEEFSYYPVPVGLASILTSTAICLEIIVIGYLIFRILSSKGPIIPILSMRITFISFHICYSIFICIFFTVVIKSIIKQNYSDQPEDPSQIPLNTILCYLSPFWFISMILMYSCMFAFWYLRLKHVFRSTIFQLSILSQRLFILSSSLFIGIELILVIVNFIVNETEEQNQIFCWLKIRSIDFIQYNSWFFLCGPWQHDCILAMAIIGAFVMPSFLISLSWLYSHRMYRTIQFTSDSINNTSSSIEKRNTAVRRERWEASFQRSLVIALTAIISSAITFITTGISFPNGALLMVIDGFVNGICMLSVFEFGDGMYQCLCALCIRKLRDFRTNMEQTQNKENINNHGLSYIPLSDVYE